MCLRHRLNGVEQNRCVCVTFDYSRRTEKVTGPHEKMATFCMKSLNLRANLLIVSAFFFLNFFTKLPEPSNQAQRVYANLLRAMGNPPHPPVLRRLPRGSAQQGGSLVYRPGTPAHIDLSDDVLDLCRTFGPDADAALACLLGHELAHFQYRHGQKQGFFSPVVMPNGTAYSSENLEALADRSGVFLAYLAGYDAFTIAPAVYRKLYDTFRLPNQIPGYPSRSQRLQMVSDTTARVRELAHYFELGEIHYLLLDYAAAGQAFSTLIARYPTATILNNLGAIKLNQALTQMTSARDDPRLRFAFPVEFDADNRLLANPRRGEPVPYRPLLADARHLFSTALARQPNYQAATLNLALTFYLLNETEKAYQTLMSSRTASRPLSANALLLLAVIEADRSKPAEAQRLFRQAAAQGAFRATDNMRLYEESQKPGWQRYWNRLVASRQSTQTAGRPSPVDRLRPAPRLPLQPLPSGGRYARTDSLTLYELSIEENNKPRWYRVVKSNRLDLADLPIGSPRSRLSAYGPPSADVAGARGSRFCGYRRGNSRLFLEYRNEQLVSWLAVTPI